jgi:hypothetical protein
MFSVFAADVNILFQVQPYPASSKKIGARRLGQEVFQLQRSSPISVLPIRHQAVVEGGSFLNSMGTCSPTVHIRGNEAVK